MPSDVVPVMLPSDQLVWVRVDDPAGRSRGPRDVSMTEAVATAMQLPGFTETVTGVISSVRAAVERHRPDSFAVEFGIEINAKTGRVLSVLAEAGGKAHVKVTATWGTPSAGQQSDDGASGNGTNQVVPEG